MSSSVCCVCVGVHTNCSQTTPLHMLSLQSVCVCMRVYLCIIQEFVCLQFLAQYLEDQVHDDKTRYLAKYECTYCNIKWKLRNSSGRPKPCEDCNRIIRPYKKEVSKMTPVTESILAVSKIW